MFAPLCEKCHQATVVALRVELFVYFRCPDCGWITSVPKPRALLNNLVPFRRT